MILSVHENKSKKVELQCFSYELKIVLQNIPLDLKIETGNSM